MAEAGALRYFRLNGDSVLGGSMLNADQTSSSLDPFFLIHTSSFVKCLDAPSIILSSEN